MKLFLKVVKICIIVILAVIILESCSLFQTGNQTDPDGIDLSEIESISFADDVDRNSTWVSGELTNNSITDDEMNNEKIHDLMIECMKSNLIRSRIEWLHYQTLEDVVKDLADDNFIDNSGEIIGEINDNDVAFITNILISTKYELQDERGEANTGFVISLEYDNLCFVEINLSDSEIYMNVSHDDEWIYYTKILNYSLYEYIFRFADKDINGFSLDILSGTESISIYYISEEDKTDFDKMGRITTIEIIDPDIIDQIKIAMRDDIRPIDAYRCEIGNDIVFHTTSGDYYGKIKFPMSDDETENTIIMQGYFWYQWDELYEILNGIEIGN